jgi:hypothetical protein
MSDSTPPRGFHLLDLAALVVGYGLASMLVRAFWPSGGMPDAPATFVLGLVYLWLGLAMSGPIVLATRRRGAAGTVADEHNLPESRTWAELAWLIIGFYWIGLTILVVPVRMRESRLFDSAILGIFPVVAALGLRLLGPRRLPPNASHASWTHRAAIAMLVTWPFAWVALILLGKTLL